MSASLQFLSFSPQTLSLHHSSSNSAAPSFFSPISLKPLQKSALSVSSVDKSCRTTSRFIPNVVGFSSEVEEEVETGDFSGSEETNFSPDLKLFVGNLPFNVDSAALAGLFEQAGNVEMVEVIYDKLSGRSRGFGFVTMSTVEEVEAAAQQFNGYELQGRAIRVNYGPPPPKDNSSFRDNSGFRGNSSYRDNNSSYRDNNSGYRENSSFRGGPRGGGGQRSDNANRVYVGNLAWGVDNLTLENLFGEQGQVQEAKVVYDRESGRSKGFGFVTMGSPQEVSKAVASLDGMDLGGRTIRVSPAEDRPPRRESQY